MHPQKQKISSENEPLPKKQADDSRLLALEEQKKHTAIAENYKKRNYPQPSSVPYRHLHGKFYT